MHEIQTAYISVDVMWQHCGNCAWLGGLWEVGQVFWAFVGRKPHSGEEMQRVTRTVAITSWLLPKAKTNIAQYTGWYDGKR